MTSTKATHGHLLGASGAIELAASVVSLTRHLVPPTRNVRTPDDGCPLNLAGDEPRHLRSRSPARRASLAPAHAAVMSNSFAFGGSNACLVVTGA